MTNVKNNRSKQAIVNIIVVVVMQVLSLLYALVSKKIFLDNFSISAYGVIDLFGSFFRTLTLLELGFGTILVYNLYKPVANGDYETIKKQLSYFKTIYLVISLIIVIIAIICGFFIYDFFNIDLQDRILVYEIYILNIISVFVKYRCLHKISLLNASGYKYISNISYMIVDTIGFLAKIISLKVFGSENLYILSLLVSPILSYLFEYIWVDRKYKLGKIKYASFCELKESGVFLQCKKYLYVIIYTLIFNSMDNIIISSKFSTDTIAYVTNYLTLFIIGRDFVVTLSSSLRGILANYYNQDVSELDFYKIFDILSSLNFLLCSIVSIGFYTLIDNFIILWIGDQYVIDDKLMIVLLIMTMIDAFFSSVDSVFVIKGYIFEQKWSLIASALTNLILTIVLINTVGLIGAYIATLIALIVIWVAKAHRVFKDVFCGFYFASIIKYIIYVMIIFSEMIIINFFAGKIFVNVNSLTMFVCKFIFIVVLTSFTNGLFVVANKNVRLYVKSIAHKIKPI